MNINLKNLKVLKKKKSSRYFLKNKFKNISLFNFSLIYVLTLTKFCKEIILCKNEIVLCVDNSFSFEFLFLFLCHHFKYQFKSLIDICAVDYYSTISSNNRFALYYNLLSVKYKIRVCIKFYCDSLRGISSLSNVFSSAN